MVQGMYAEKSQSTMALILSIFGLVCCGIAGPIGWYMGQQELNGIEAGLRDPSGKGTANAAKIIGIIATALWVLGIIFYAIALVVAAADSA